MKLIRYQRPEISTWPAFGRLSDLRDEVDRLFGPTFGELTGTSPLLSGWSPALDLFEDKDNLVVKAELPGMKKDEIDISLHDGCLSISGERKSDQTSNNAEVYRTERYYGRFQRTVALPSPVAADKVRAQYQDGVLTITLPKTEEAKPKRIDVSAN
jgi:HSP20 family protein